MMDSCCSVVSYDNGDNTDIDEVLMLFSERGIIAEGFEFASGAIKDHY